MDQPINYETPPDPAAARRAAKWLAVRIIVRTLLAATCAASCWVAWYVWNNGPNGSGSAMQAAVRVIEVALAVAIVSGAALLLSFGSRKR